MSITNQMNMSTEGSIDILKQIYNVTMRNSEELRDLDKRFSSLESRLNGFEKRFTGIEICLEGLEARFLEVEGRFTGIEDRLTGLEGRLTGVENRLAGLEGRFEGVEDHVKGLEGKIKESNDLLDEAREDFLSTIVFKERQFYQNYKKSPKDIYGRRESSPSRYNLGQSPFFWER